MTPDSLTAAEIVFSGGSTYMDKFVEKAFGEIAKSLFSNTKYSKVDLDSLGVKYAATVEQIPQLSSLSLSNNDIKGLRPILIHKCAATLLQLSLGNFIPRALIYDAKDNVVVYPNLRYLHMHTCVYNTYDERIQTPSSIVPFPALNSLRLYLPYPFADDTLFRGNGSTLKDLRIVIDRDTAIMLSKSLEFDNNFRKLRTVAIVEAKDYDSPDTVGDFVLSKSLKNLIDSARILNLIADCYVKNLVASYGREFEHIKVLDMGLTQLTLFDTMRLLRALPNLVKLSCGIGKLGSELSNIPSKELPDHMVTTYRAVGNRLYNLNTSLEKGISVIEAADFVMLLTLVCPRLRRVGSSHAAPPAYYARITKALNRKPFSKYASQLQHLLDNAGQQTRQFVIMVPLINHHGLFTI
ncbi:hypothetical protein GGH13_003087 [Coemansia sp. S155-1]|nr:hypothetical protein GGH13_003087 [Coemansia sp. S155-1]